MTLMLRHMLYRVVGYAGAVSLVLVVVVLLSTTQRMFYLLAEGAITPGQLLEALGLLVPAHIYEVVPLAVTIAIAHAYLRWSQSNEIVSLRMAGLSDWALALPGLGAATAALVLTAAMSLYFVPISFRTFEDIKYAADFNVSLSLLDEGYLQQIAPDLSMSFRRRLRTGEIEGVTILDGRKSGSFTYILAERAALVNRGGADGKRVLVLQNGTYQVRHGSEESVTPVHFEELALPVSGSALASSRIREWRGFYEEHIGRLLDPPPEVRADPDEYGEWKAEGHKRLLMPLLCLSYATFALGMMLLASYERHTAPILRIAVVAAGVGAWHGLLIATHSLVVRMPELIPAYYLTAVLPGIAGALMLISSDRGARRTAQSLVARVLGMVPAKAPPGTS